MTNSIRPVVVASQLENGEAQDATSPLRDVDGLKTVPRGKLRRENQTKLRGRQQVAGDGMIGSFNTVNKET